MSKTELIIAPGTSDGMKKMAESLNPQALLLAYRNARETFNTPDVVLIAHQGNNEGFFASPRSSYIEKAFVRFNEHLRKSHPLVRESAQMRLQMPAEAACFWLVIEMPEQNAVGFCAIGAYLHNAEQKELS